MADLPLALGTGRPLFESKYEAAWTRAGDKTPWDTLPRAVRGEGNLPKSKLDNFTRDVDNTAKDGAPAKRPTNREERFANSR